jgi:hypothetical protein
MRVFGVIDRRQIAVVGRLDDDHFIARMDRAQDRCQKRLRRACRHRDFGRGVVAASVQACYLLGDRLTQRRDACHRRVLVVAFAHRVGHGIDDARIAIEIRKTLAEIDRVLLGGERAHHGEDRRADVRQTGRERWRHGGHRRGRQIVRCVHVAVRMRS